MTRRVVITGLGVISPVGCGVEKFWNSLKEGQNGIDFITHFDISEYKAKLAAEVKDFEVEKYMEKKKAKRLDMYSQFAIASTKEAIEDSGLDLDNIDRERVGVIFGTGVGGIGTAKQQVETLAFKGPRRISPFAVPMLICNMAAGNIAIEFGLKGNCISIVTACATSTNCIGEAYRSIKHGYSDIVVAGGSESSIDGFSIAGFQSLTALSTSEDKNRASIPFDSDRSGFVMGEGSGTVILEELESALKRGAKIYGEVVGYGTTCDAYHITSPSPDGEGAAKAMKMAMDEAGIDKNASLYINAHGTSTKINDKMETLAIKTVFAKNAKNIPVSSTKSMTGHLLGAAGAIEAIAAIKAMKEGFLPPTINLKNKDEDCDLDYIPNVGREQEVEYAMSNSFGFGGHNGSIIFKKWRE